MLEGIFLYCFMDTTNLVEAGEVFLFNQYVSKMKITHRIPMLNRRDEKTTR